jgi:hypothetical protein
MNSDSFLRNRLVIKVEVVLIIYPRPEWPSSALKFSLHPWERLIHLLTCVNLQKADF